MNPGRPQREVVRRHLLALDETLRVLRGQTGRPVGDLRKDVGRRWTVERGLQLAAQNVLDVATHIASGEGRDTPDYASAIDALGDLGVLPVDFAARIRGLAGFRNVLVHAYLEVDLARVHVVLNERLDDFVEFAEHVDTWLGR